MAEFKHGVNGAFSGKVGSVVGSNWRDINYMRSLPKKSSKAASAKQVAVRARFTVLTQFLLLVKDAIDRGYSKQYSGRASAYNLAVQANQVALTGTDLDPQLDYSKITLSKGHTLAKPFGCKLTYGDQGHILVNWEVFSGSEERMMDKATIVLYCAERHETIVSVDDFDREDEVADFEIPSNWVNATVHGYIFMTSEAGANSATAYVGSLPII